LLLFQFTSLSLSLSLSLPSPLTPSLFLLPSPPELPALPTVDVPQEEQSDDFVSDWAEEAPKEKKKFKKTSGPKIQDPYASDESWFMPITMAIAVFLPVLFCLCRVR
jgi:hypothetical protein